MKTLKVSVAWKLNTSQEVMERADVALGLAAMAEKMDMKYKHVGYHTNPGPELLDIIAIMMCEMSERE